MSTWNHRNLNTASFTNRNANVVSFAHRGQSLSYSFLLLENGGLLLQEDGTSYLILEPASGGAPVYTHRSVEIG